MRLGSFRITQEVFDFDFDGAVYKLKSLNGDQYATFQMFVSGTASGFLNSAQKFDFIKNNILGWSDVYGYDDQLIEYSDKAKTIFLDEELDQVLNILIIQCYLRRKEIIEKVESDKESAGK